MLGLVFADGILFLFAFWEIMGLMSYLLIGHFSHDPSQPFFQRWATWASKKAFLTTRIGDCLREFNLRWSRRILAQGAVVLLITDGLDCGEGADLGAQMNRLRASSRQILWLNPLLRFEGFEPRAAGIRAMLPHVDRFLPAHNIASLLDLQRALSQAPVLLAHRLH